MALDILKEKSSSWSKKQIVDRLTKELTILMALEMEWVKFRKENNCLDEHPIGFFAGEMLAARMFIDYLEERLN